MAERKSKAGRPSLYNKDTAKKFCKQAAKLAALGATDVAIADFFEVSVETIDEWKVVHPEFQQAIKAAKDEVDSRVVQSLYKRAMGFKRKVQKPSRDGVVECEEEVLPDTIACIFWLKNRQRKDWRDKQDVEHSGGINIVPVFELTTKEK